MTSYKEEIFGPVATVIKSQNVEESIRMANDSDFGLSSSVWGDDLEECKNVASKLDGGMVFINA
jgi:acyl-CoA reductase-like NAD-dependent aldehyde dehydrogenase